MSRQRISTRRSCTSVRLVVGEAFDLHALIEEPRDGVGEVLVGALHLEDDPAAALLRVDVRSPDVRDETEALTHGVNDGLADQMLGKGEMKLSLRHRSGAVGRVHAPGAETLQVD